jgi:D-sedoheptulose 7-phosphate isomerase
VRAIRVSRDAGIGVVGFTGQSGGAMAELCDVCFCMPTTETPKVQEGHEFLGHLICGLIELEMFASPIGR